MVEIEALDALDLTIWFGRGGDAASRLDCNQSTVSRRSNHCLQVFNLPLQRDGEGWPLTPDSPLLTMQREVHQLDRLRRGQGLRLDASLLAAPLLRGWSPGDWVLGNLDALGWQRPLQLLEHRILDAWITAMGQELQNCRVTDLCCIPLLITPMQLAAAAGHPLHGEGELTLNDVAGLPRLAPRPGSYPRTEQLLGRWRERRQALTLECSHKRRASDPAIAATVRTLHYGTRFSLAHQSDLKPLPLELGVATELTLVMRQDVSEHAAMLQLMETLRQRATQAALNDLGTPGRN